MSTRTTSSALADAIVWPTTRVDGSLDAARGEWIELGAAGAYASSTAAQLHTRRHHGLLVAELPAPLGRHVIVSHLDASVVVDGARHALETHQFPSIAPTRGYEHLVSFSQDPLPRWIFAVGGGTLEQTLALVADRDAIVVRFAWSGPGDAELVVRPLLAMRPIDALVREHGSMLQSVELRHGEVRVRPVRALPRVVFGHSATFVGSPDWWRRFEYLDERRDGAEFQEDLWTPGVFSTRLAAGASTYLVAAVDSLPPERPEALLDDATSTRLAGDPGPRATPFARRLSVTAAAFGTRRGGRPAAVAGLPRGQARARDALASLAGTYLVSGRADEAARVLELYAASMRDGLVASELAEGDLPATWDAADSTLWLLEAARLWLDHAGEGTTRTELGSLGPRLVAGWSAIDAGTARGVRARPDGLVEIVDPVSTPGFLRTPAGTPRAGAPVELQALWARASETVARLADASGDTALAARARDARRKTLATAHAKLFSTETGSAYDTLPALADASRGALADASIRPTAVLALAIEPKLFGLAETLSIVDVAGRDLLTPFGLRTLAQSSPDYRPTVDVAAPATLVHAASGDVWPLFTGAWVRARRRISPHDPDVRAELSSLVASTLSNALAPGHVPERVTGEAPHRPFGDVSHAWSAAELARATAWDLA